MKDSKYFTESLSNKKPVLGKYSREKKNTILDVLTSFNLLTKKHLRTLPFTTAAASNFLHGFSARKYHPSKTKKPMICFTGQNYINIAVHATR